MRGGRALEVASDHQAKLVKLLDEMRLLLAATTDLDPAALATVRWQLMRGLREYQLFKQQEIFDRLTQHESQVKAALVSGMRRRCLASVASYISHIARWSNIAATARRERHLYETRRVINTLGMYLDREGGELRFLLDQGAKDRKATALPASGPEPETTSQVDEASATVHLLTSPRPRR